MQKPKEFEITLKVKVEADNLTVAECLATAIVNDLLKCGEEYVDRPINHVRWSRITPVGPFAPIAVNESGREPSIFVPTQEDSDAWGEKLTELGKTLRRAGCPGCINCGPPIMVKADDGCDGRLV